MMYNKKNRINYRIRKNNRSNRHILSVEKTEKHIYAQIKKGKKVICEYSSVNNNIKGYNCEGAKKVGAEIAKLAKSHGIEKVVFNRNEHLYTGRIEALAQSAREILEF